MSPINEDDVAMATPHATAEPATAEPQEPAEPVMAKYDQDNPPSGWTYVNYRDQPGGGFSCPSCGQVEDGADVDGHSS